MKRPPGLWLLLSAGVVWLSLQNAYGLKATELLFRKTTTTSTEVAPQDEQKETATETIDEEENTVKSNLTGNPQLDYIYDPNLPRELNGYNLSSYPFYNSMPEDIAFKCDGLHDGFYASIVHKCQVYHHCLFGTRFDFLCANYTAFDQKTFICHFVSEVDCNNSQKYWHRNDALYQTASTTTTTSKPVVIAPALTAVPRRPPPPGLRRRRPSSRRRPQYEYYDEEYEEEEDDYEEPPPRRRRKRPRPRPRPIYEDDYEDYEDERYERRGGGTRNGNDNRKTHDRRTPEAEQKNKKSDNRDYGEKDRKEPNDGNVQDNERKLNEDRRSGHDERKSNDRRDSDERHNVDGSGSRKQHDRREFDDRRYEDRHSDKRYKDERRREYDDRGRYGTDVEDARYDRDNRNRRPSSGARDEDDERRPSQDGRVSTDDRRYEKRRPADDYDRPRKTQRRPYEDDQYDDTKQQDRRSTNAPRKNENKEDPQQGSSLVKPNSSSSVFNQPRMPPRIRPPAPKNDQNKLKTTTERPKKSDNVEYDDYEDEPPPKRSNPKSNRKPESESTETRRSNNKATNSDREETRRPAGSVYKPRTVQPYRKPTTEDTLEEERPRSRQNVQPRNEPEYRDGKVGTNNRNRPIEDSDKQDDENSSPPNKLRNGNFQKFLPKETRGRNELRERTRSEPTTTTSTSTTTTTTTTRTTTTTTPIPTTTQEPPRERQEPIVKVVKRPFLPSRGGNPFTARGLQPVGAKALDSFIDEAEITTKPSVREEPPRNNERHPPLLEENSNLDEEDYDEPTHNSPIIAASPNNEKPLNQYISDVPSQITKNGRQFPAIPTEPKINSFVINEQPIDSFRRRPVPTSELPPKVSYGRPSDATENEEEEFPEKPFKPSPVMNKVPLRIMFPSPVEDEEEEFRPVSNRPQSALRVSSKPRLTTQKPNIPERNPLDISENEYDVTLNDALNPTIPNLPIRNFPGVFNPASDYTYSSFHRTRYDAGRSPSQRVETVVQPYITTSGRKIANTNAQYTLVPEQIYQQQNFRSNPQVTQAQTHGFYQVY